MKKPLVLAFALLLALPTYAADIPYTASGKIQVVEPSTTSPNASNRGPATDAEVAALIDALGVKDSLQAAVDAATPLVRQSYNDLLNKTMNEQGVRLSPEQTTALSNRIAEKHNKLKKAMFDWMIKEYIKRHKATYTQAETLQILTFMKTPVGAKYVQNDSRVWASILTEVNNQFAKLIPTTVAQAFREAGALR